MICKYCFAEVEDGTAVCPICGKELETPVEETAQEEVAEVVEEVTAEETPVKEKKKSNAWKKLLDIWHTRIYEEFEREDIRANLWL